VCVCVCGIELLSGVWYTQNRLKNRMQSAPIARRDLETHPNTCALGVHLGMLFEWTEEHSGTTLGMVPGVDRLEASSKTWWIPSECTQETHLGHFRMHVDHRNTAHRITTSHRNARRAHYTGLSFRSRFNQGLALTHWNMRIPAIRYDHTRCSIEICSRRDCCWQVDSPAIG
jgi:hypothetical protein